MRIAVFALAIGWSLAGCHILGLADVPCTTGEHCRPGEACVDGFCTLASADGGTLDDAGALDDGGVVIDDDAGTPSSPVDCQEIKARTPSSSTGLHTIFPPGAPGGVTVWCEMEVAGGGWTLAARSSSSGSSSVPWGWHATTGTPDDNTAPYAAGLATLGLSASELLVGEYTGDDDETRLDRNVYHLVFASDVLDPALGDVSIARTSLVVIESACEEQLDLALGQPWMLTFAGCLDRTDVFHLRDNASCENFGLFPDGFGIAYDDCAYAGGMGFRDEGAIFVR